MTFMTLRDQLRCSTFFVLYFSSVHLDALFIALLFITLTSSEMGNSVSHFESRDKTSLSEVA